MKKVKDVNELGMIFFELKENEIVTLNNSYQKVESLVDILTEHNIKEWLDFYKDYGVLPKINLYKHRLEHNCEIEKAETNDTEIKNSLHYILEDFEDCNITEDVIQEYTSMVKQFIENHNIQVKKEWTNRTEIECYDIRFVIKNIIIKNK